MQFALSLFVILLAADPNDSAAAKASIDRMKADLTYLSSDELEGRGINTDGVNKAAEHIRNEFKKAGLKSGTPDGSYFQPFKYGRTYKVDPTKTRLAVGGRSLQLGKEYMPMATGGSAPFKGQLVFAGYGITAEGGQYDDYKGLDVAGKVVLVMRRTPRQDQNDDPVFGEGKRDRYASLDSKINNAINHKAAGLLFVSDPFTVKSAAEDKLEETNYLGRPRGQGFPVAHVTQTTANALLKSSSTTSLAEAASEIDKDLKPRAAASQVDGQFEFTPVQLAINNVIGVIEGSGPHAHETVVIGAHYDHVGYGNGFGASLGGSAARGKIHHGADDNGSGTTAMLETARRFAARKTPPSRRLVFMAFCAEEVGLIGSKYYASESPIFPIKDTVAMLNMDMVGRLREGKLEIAGNKSAVEFEPMLNDLNSKLHFDMKMGPAAIRGDSDHASFSNVGVPVLFFFTGMHPQYHKPTDTVDLINFEGMEKIVELAEGVVEQFSNMTRPQFIAPPRRGFSLLGGGDRPRASVRMGIMPNYNHSGDGVEAEEVSEGSPAEKAGMKAKDVILEIGGEKVKDMEAYMAAMRKFKPGDKTKLKVMRGKDPVTLEVEFAATGGGPPSTEKKSEPKSEKKAEPAKKA